MTGVAILGAGAFGSALAIALAVNGPVTLWGRGGRSRLDVPLPEAVRLTGDLDEVRAPTVLIALPAQVIRPFLASEGRRLDGRALIGCAKGIDVETLTGTSAVIAAACPSATVALLTGPSFAADIARGLPTALTLACADEAAGAALQTALATPVLRLYRTTDVTGAELGGALKNVVAIAAGVAIGAGLGDSARAAIVTRGMAEIVRLATTLGARPETLMGLSGLGDLVLTCTSDQSRNFRYGRALGAGEPFDAGITVEGAATARAVARMAQDRGLDLPVATTVAALAGGGISVNDAIRALLMRPLRQE